MVEDDAAVLGSPRFLLETDGFVVQTFRNATALLNARGAPGADCYVIDYKMPDINGIEAAKRMSTLNPRVPLILFTVLELQGLEQAAREAGICSIVSKAQAWDLIKSIETAVGSIGGATASLQIQ